MSLNKNEPTTCVLRSVALVATLTLAGCATVYEGRYPWSDGWRSAEIVEVVKATEMARPQFFECVRKATPEQLANARYAVVRYRLVSRTQNSAVPLREGETYAPGDRVYFQAGRCDASLVRRSARA